MSEVAVAVTGATGFIGSAVVRKLLEQKRTVRCLVEPGANAANLDGLPVERVSVDVTDFPGMKRALEGCSSLFHLAAIYKTWLRDEEIIHRVNVEGTTATLLAAQHAKVKRVVYTSSIAAIGLASGGRGLADESTKFNLFDVANPYILTKWQSERIAMRFAESGLPVVIVNPAFPFGPRDIAPTPTGGIILALLRRQVPAVTPGGICTIDVDDCAEAHLLAEERGRVGERYILGNDNVTMKELFEITAKVANVPCPKLPMPGVLAAGVALGMELWADHVSHKEPPATYRSMRYTQRNAFFSNAKAKRELGLRTRPLEETIARAVEWFRGDFQKLRG
ncbi:MAG: NAD-dependent epimerase/dehydratase family protein [Labilithrix sp.]|nr:NAD-dependent epimerase/dehydratase family protein [Labilithrix sp.]